MLSSCKYFVRVLVLFFFFQAEDGIRYDLVTGVQTCALPICREPARRGLGAGGAVGGQACRPDPAGGGRRAGAARRAGRALREIGRASCRERGENSVGAAALKEKEVSEE